MGESGLGRREGGPVEDRAATIEERIAWAFDVYKAFSAFKAEVAEGCIEAYRFGFGDCK